MHKSLVRGGPACFSSYSMSAEASGCVLPAAPCSVGFVFLREKK